MRDITTDRESIFALQEYLRELHHDTNGEIPLVNPDGIYGSETVAAVEEFQRRHGLPVTGEVDNETWDAIFAEFGNAVIRRSKPNGIMPFPSTRGYEVMDGERSDTVMAVQLVLHLLANLYDDIDGSTMGGIYDESTAADIRTFQTRHNLPVTGRVDKLTWNALADAYNRAMEVDVG